MDQCKRKVEFVRRVYSRLESTRHALCAAWKRECGRTVDSINPPSLADIRAAVVEVSNIMIAYEEFAERVTIQ